MHTRSDITALFSIGAVLLLCTCMAATASPLAHPDTSVSSNSAGSQTRDIPLTNQERSVLDSASQHEPEKLDNPNMRRSMFRPGPGDYAEAAIDPADASEKKRLRRRGWYPSYGDYYYAAPYAGGYYGVPYAGGYYGAPYGGVLDLQLGLGLHI